ncbi:MAG: hypothetical protein V1844_18595 [Pseudomonadota bacterium]
MQIGTRTAHKAREGRDLLYPSLPWETGGNYLVVSRKLNNRYRYCGLHIYMKKAGNPKPGGNKRRNPGRRHNGNAAWCEHTPGGRLSNTGAATFPKKVYSDTLEGDLDKLFSDNQYQT